MPLRGILIGLALGALLWAPVIWVARALLAALFVALAAAPFIEAADVAAGYRAGGHEIMGGM